jgi:hypothetical protein
MQTSTQERYTALHLAVKGERRDIVKLLLTHGVRKDMRDKAGKRRYSMYTKLTGHIHVHGWIRMHKLPHMQDGRTPLDLARYLAHLDTAKLLTLSDAVWKAQKTTVSVVQNIGHACCMYTCYVSACLHCRAGCCGATAHPRPQLRRSDETRSTSQYDRQSNVICYVCVLSIVDGGIWIA